MTEGQDSYDRAEWQYLGKGPGGASRYIDSAGHTRWMGPGRAVDITPPWPAGLQRWLSRDYSNRDLRPFVQPYAGSAVHHIHLAADDHLVSGGDRRRLGRHKQGPVSCHLLGLYLDFAAGAGSEEGSFDDYVLARTWDRIAEVVEALRVPEDDSL